MPNPILYYQSCENATLTALVGTDSGYSVQNLKDRNRNTFWKWSFAGASTATVADFGSSQSFDSCIISDATSGNALDANGLLLQASTDNFVSSSVSIGTFPSTISTQITNYTNIVSFSPASYRYWRIYSYAPGTFIKYSTWFIGTKYTFPSTPEYPGGVFGDYDYESNLYQTGLSGGNNTSQKFYNGKREWDWNFVLTAAQMTTLEGVLNTIQGSHLPVWMSDTASNLVFCRIYKPRKSTTENPSYGFRKVHLIIREE